MTGAEQNGTVESGVEGREREKKVKADKKSERREREEEKGGGNKQGVEGGIQWRQKEDTGPR